MMLLLAAGVKKSLIFNNILNAINLAVWVFVMTAGLFYVNTDNWTKHGGFLPYGWSGVSTNKKANLFRECKSGGRDLEKFLLGNFTSAKIQYPTTSQLLRVKSS